jgi:hypothetical protein
VITITNYAEYAQKMDDLPAHYPAQISELKPAHDEASNGAASEGDAAHSGEHNGERFPRIMNNKVITTIKTLKDLRRRILANPPTSRLGNYRSSRSWIQNGQSGELLKTCVVLNGFSR